MEFIDYKYFVGDNTDSLIYGYTKRNGGYSPYPIEALNMALYVDDIAENVHRNQDLLAEEIGIPKSEWILPIQKHGGNVKEVFAKDKGTNVEVLTDSLYDVDAMYTHDLNVLLTLNLADCIPVYVISRKNNFIGLAHAGWRGTSQGVTSKLIDAYNGDPHDLEVLIGVGINEEHYLVDEAVIDAVQSYGLPHDAYGKQGDKYSLNLKRANQYQAISKGVKISHIHTTELGTEDTNTFFSYRLEEGKTGRALAFIGRKVDVND